MSCVYIHINKINQKKYVGITTHSDPIRRYGKEGKNYEGSRFYNEGISQYGWNNFDHLVLMEEVDNYVAEQVEARLIKELKLTEKEFGYNESFGATIKIDNSIDIIVENLLNKINKYNHTDFSITEISTGYTHTTNKYLIEFIYEGFFKKGRINTDLDCQRGYVWTDERQQGMWDTLLKGHRIPEIHVIRDGLNYDIIDGKQRLTTIIKIIDNEIPFLKRYASKNLIPLFTSLNKTKIFFKDLPKELSERIYNTSITFAEYSDIEEEELISLFRKLNASMSLSEFSKGIANNINIRIGFTRYLINHSSLKKVFSEKDRLNNNDEKTLIRLAFLLKYGVGEVDLQPKNLSEHYQDFSSVDLKDAREKIEKILDSVEKDIELLANFRQKDSYLPVILLAIYNYNLSQSEIKKLFEDVKKSNWYVKGENFDKKICKQRFDNVVKLIK